MYNNKQLFDPNKTNKILSFDGGGMLGVIPTQFLILLEQKYGTEWIKNETSLIGGTSTGAIIACALSFGYRPKEILNAYFNYALKIFPDPKIKWLSKFIRIFKEGISNPLYSNTELKNMLYDFFGGSKFGDLKIPTMVISYNTKDNVPVVFKSFKKEHKNILVRDVILASTSAPVYFPGTKITIDDNDIPLIDGGVATNNPSISLIAELIRNNVPIKNIELHSFGTGLNKTSLYYDQIKQMGAIEWAPHIINILMDGSVEIENYIARQLLGTKYHRYNIHLPKNEDYKMDTNDPVKLNKLVELVTKHGI